MKIFLFKNGKPAGSPGSDRAPATPASSPSAVSSPSKVERKAQSAGPAKDLKKPANKDKLPEAVRKMPEGKFKELAKAAVDLGKQYGLSKNVIEFAITLCAFMGQYAHLVDRIPGNYRKSLNEGDLGKEKFSDKQRKRSKEQRKRLKEQMLKGVPKDYEDFYALYGSYNSKTKLDASMTSTLFVSYMLFGSGGDVDHLTNHKVLAAKLAHESGYKDSTLLSLKRQKIIPEGTVIFFSKNLKSGIIVAYATGNRKEFKYFVPKSKKPKTFQLDGADSPIRSELNLLAAFVPNTLSEVKPPDLAQEELVISKLEEKVRLQMQNKNITKKYDKIAEILSPALQKVNEEIKQDPRHEELVERYMEIIKSVISELEKDIEKMEKAKKPVSRELKALITKFREYIF